MIQTYRETIRPLYAYVSRRVGGDLSLAEDLVQETWMRALDAWPKQGMPDQPLAWLLRVAHNTLVSHFRRIRPEPIDPALIDLLDERASSPLSPATEHAAAVIGWGLARLRQRHAEILEAFYFDGQSVSEIAAARRLSARAVEGRLRRARIKLKNTLERIGDRSCVTHTNLRTNSSSGWSSASATKCGAAIEPQPRRPSGE